MRYLPFILLLFCTPLYAAIEPHIIERADGGISVMYYNTESRFTPAEERDRQGFVGRPITKIKMSDIPQSREDRNYWKKSGDKIVIDTARKNTDEAKTTARQSKLLGIQNRLGLDDEDLGLIRKGV